MRARRSGNGSANLFIRGKLGSLRGRKLRDPGPAFGILHAGPWRVGVFTPDSACTWLLTEIDADGIAFGLCDLGMREPELRYVSLHELHTARGQLGLSVERDLAIAIHVEGKLKAGGEKDQIAETMPFQNIGSVGRHFESLDPKLDLAAALRKPYRKRKQSLFELIEFIVSARHDFVHRAKLTLALTDNRMYDMVYDLDGLRGLRGASLGQRFVASRLSRIPFLGSALTP